MKKRLIYFGLSFLCFIACFVIVESFSGNQVIRGFLGDIIIVLLIYFFIKGLHDFNPIKLGIFTLLIAFGTEFLQYLQITKILGLEKNSLVQLVFGAVFDPFDLLAYTIGAVLAVIIDKKVIIRLKD